MCQKIGADHHDAGSCGQRIAKAGQQVDNSGFESGMGGWVWGGSEATAVTDASKAHSGTKYLQLSTSTGVVSAHDKVLAVRTGEVVRFGGWVYPESGDGSSFWKLVAYDSGMNPVEYPGYITLSQGSWQLQDQTYTVPSGVAYVRLYTQIYQPTGASVVRFDDGFLIAGTEYYHGDHLGSSRLMTDASGAKTWEATYLPFGYEINPQSTTNHYKFTGKERDAETGLDYFGARYHSSTMGRFVSPDEYDGGPVEVYGGSPAPPGPLPYADITNPQSLNKYSYTYNNPLKYTDPAGHCVTDPLSMIVCGAAVLGAIKGANAYWDYKIRIQEMDNLKNNVIAAKINEAQVCFSGGNCAEAQTLTKKTEYNFYTKSGEALVEAATLPGTFLGGVSTDKKSLAGSAVTDEAVAVAKKQAETQRKETQEKTALRQQQEQQRKIEKERRQDDVERRRRKRGF
ncbi:MAG: RHS repeat-associated core domain-containing protein [Candidatus Korobacteraceae bacterium]